MNIQRSEKMKVTENYGTATENRMSIYLKRFLLLNSASKFRPEHTHRRPARNTGHGQTLFVGARLNYSRAGGR